MARKPIEFCLLLLAPCAVAAQTPAPAATPDTGMVYRREVFQYAAASRPDPFRPLLGGDDLGIRVEALRLTAVLYDPKQNRSVAIFARGDVPGAIRLRVGQRVGNITVLRILPRRVDLRIDELGVSRVEAMTLRRAVPDAGVPADVATPGAPAASGAVTEAAPPPPPPGPLTRGGRPRPAAPAQPTRRNNP